MKHKHCKWILIAVTVMLFCVPAVMAGSGLVVAVPDTFISMDPHNTNDTLGYSAQKTMMQGLVGFDKDMNVLPLLAESYKANDQATEFIFKLRRGIKFHDGTPFNAKAVKVNVERLANPKNKLKRHSLFAMVSKVTEINNYTVKVELKEPFGAMINNFAHPCALMHSPKSLAEKGKEVSRGPVGTGPFMFSKWVPGDHLKVVKNPNYWRPGFPKVDSVTFKPTPENGSRIAMLQTGEAHFIYPVPPEQAEIVKKDKNIILDTGESIIVRYLAMNCYHKPFSDVRVRKAVSLAINRNSFKKVVARGYLDTPTSILAPKVQYYAAQKPLEYDLKKAKKLLKEAGYPKGFSVEVWANNSSNVIKGMEFIQQQLAMIGIKVKVIPMESGTRSERIWSVKTPEEAKIRMYYAGWSPSTGDADWGIRPLFSSVSFPPKSFNTAYYNNKEVDGLIKAAITTANPDKRKTAYAKIQKIIWEDYPWAVLGVSQTMSGRQFNLKGFYRLADGSLLMEEAEIVK